MMNNFEVLNEMAATNKDIRMTPLSNIVEVRITKRGGEVTIGIDDTTARRYLAGKDFVGGLIFADREQFEQIKQAGELKKYDNEQPRQDN